VADVAYFIIDLEMFYYSYYLNDDFVLLGIGYMELGFRFKVGDIE
jgi:hypothetical protein